MRGTLNNLTFSMTGEQLLTISTKEDLRSLFDDLKDGEVTVTIKKFHPKRSLDANAYAWVLMDKLSEATGVPKTEIYRKAIREIGGNSETVCVQNKAVDSLRDGWERHGIGWLTETMPSRIENCTVVHLYYGSSTFDTAQMSRLIDGLIQDCKALNIETMPPDKLNSLLEAWNGR